MRVRDAVGAPTVRLHDLRHFTATQLISAGVDIRTVAERLGHSDPSLTLRVYAHVIEERTGPQLDHGQGALGHEEARPVRPVNGQTWPVTDGRPSRASLRGDGRRPLALQPAWWHENPEATSEAVTVAEWLDSRAERRSVGETIPTKPVQRLTLTVEEAASTLGISRATAYEAVSRGEIPCIRIGRRILIPKVALDRLLTVSPSVPIKIPKPADNPRAYFVRFLGGDHLGSYVRN